MFSGITDWPHGGILSNLPVKHTASSDGKPLNISWENLDEESPCVLCF